MNSEDLLNKLLSSRGVKAGEKQPGEGSSQVDVCLCWGAV